jgi:hypothetical protein
MKLYYIFQAFGYYSEGYKYGGGMDEKWKKGIH